MSLPALDTVTGCLLVGTWASSLLYMVEVIQSFYYFRHFEQDDWKFKALVTVALLIDTLSTVGDYICLYLYTITHAGDLEYLDNIHWPIPLYGFTTGVLAALVEAFLVVRYWRFTRNTLIALFLSFGIIISFGSVFTCSLLLTLYTSFGDRPKFKIPAALWLVTEVAVDAGIASALLWEFRKARKTLTETHSVLERLNRLTAVTIQSGAAAATLAGTALISYYIKPESNIYMSFLYPLGRVYVITLLSNLNIRKTGRSLSTTDTSPYRGTTGGGREPLSITHWATDDSYGIHVHRTVHTSVQVIGVESPQDRLPATFKSPLRSAAIDSSPEEMEMTANYSSKKQSTLFAA
ncbi:hypothetical protein C8F04DRAFT_1133689 [Mycena alexandri]|uniref:DUF6534 domain-containing protein n=1 Tax=Mycena alexandri TaxID=1745969 RepID=A0AAD6SE55_9AGAR|nr:hypothetical protein C8F04DRAFT_1133689 [Mycena alexandri]